MNLEWCKGWLGGRWSTVGSWGDDEGASTLQARSSSKSATTKTLSVREHFTPKMEGHCTPKMDVILGLHYG